MSVSQNVPSHEVPALFAFKGARSGSGKSGEYVGALELQEGSGYKHSSGRYLMTHDGVGISFWLANGIMFASTLFFFVESQNVPRKWRGSVVTAGLVTLVAFYNYCYMRAIWVQTQQSPQIYRYTDWLITVPLQVVEFYLILQAQKPDIGTGLVTRLMMASLIMLTAGYLGDVGIGEVWIMFAVGTSAWLYIIYQIFYGDAAAIQDAMPSKAARQAFISMRSILTYGWALYPLGYIVGHTGPAADSGSPAMLNAVYNIADLVNKTAFGLAVYSAARSEVNFEDDESYYNYRRGARVRRGNYGARRTAAAGEILSGLQEDWRKVTGSPKKTTRV